MVTLSSSLFPSGISGLGGFGIFIRSSFHSLSVVFSASSFAFTLVFRSQSSAIMAALFSGSAFQIFAEAAF
jgi:hypothetical protein